MNLSGRYDDYSDFGSTINPKFAFNWTVVNGAAGPRELRGIVHRAGAHQPRHGGSRRHGGILVRRAHSARRPPASTRTSRSRTPIPARSACRAARPPRRPASSTAATRARHLSRGRQQGPHGAGGRDLLRRLRLHAGGAVRDCASARRGGTRNIIGAITAPQAAFAIGAPDLYSLLQLFPGGVPPATIAAATAGLAADRPARAPLRTSSTASSSATRSISTRTASTPRSPIASIRASAASTSGLRLRASSRWISSSARAARRSAC